MLRRPSPQPSPAPDERYAFAEGKGLIRSPIRRVHCNVSGDFALPPRTVLQKPVLVVEEFLARLDREFEIRPFDDRVDRAGFLPHAAIDAFDHVDVVARRASCAAVAPRPRLDGDRLGAGERLAPLPGAAT